MKVKVWLKEGNGNNSLTSTGTWTTVPLNLFLTPEEDDLYIAVIETKSGTTCVIPKSNIASIDILPEEEGHVGEDE